MADGQPAAFEPDLKAPRRRLPEWTLWVLALGALAAAGAGAWYWKKHHKPEAEPQKIVTESTIPDDFFKIPEKKEKEPEPPPKPAEKPAPAPAPMVPPKKLTATDLFEAQPVAPKPPPPDPVELFNDQRRRAGGVSMVARAGRLEEEPPEWINTQEDFPEEQKTIASYPVDLSRVVTEDRNFPAVVVEAINSELGGKVTATIEENIYGFHGRFVLIPAGSVAIGRYKPLNKPGDERIMIIWHRIITKPDGINIRMGNAEMADAMGRAGITGDVDNRFMERYGLALLVSSVSAAASYAVPVTTQGQAVIVQTYGSNVANLSNQILEKNINLKPKIDLQPGQRILIAPQKDIWFKKPERKEIEVVALDSVQRNAGGTKR